MTSDWQWIKKWPKSRKAQLRRIRQIQADIAYDCSFIVYSHRNLDQPNMKTVKQISEFLHKRADDLVDH